MGYSGHRFQRQPRLSQPELAAFFVVGAEARYEHIQVGCPVEGRRRGRGQL